jgi:hypothetical protein
MMTDISPFASKLDLSNQGLTEVPEAILRCKNLRKLNLSNNQIKMLPPELSRLKRLQNLDLGNNQISTLYAGNFDLPQLEVLILRNNKLKKMPHQIGALDKLKVLNLSGNQLVELPNDITRLADLEELSLANNSFSTFPIQLLEFAKMKLLWLNNNPLSDLPITELHSKMPDLKAIYCFSPLSNYDLDPNYKLLQAKKGNGLSQFNLLALKDKPKKTMAITIPNRITSGKKHLFISYCHADIEWLNKINTALQTMAYEGLELEIWDDTRLNAGDLWKKEIATAIAKADAAILLVSNSFLASKFIREQEVPPLLKKAEESGARILPVIVGLCRFTKSTLKEYQSVNKPERPMNALSIHEQEKVIYDLTIEIDKAFE